MIDEIYGEEDGNPDVVLMKGTTKTFDEVKRFISGYLTEKDIGHDTMSVQKGVSIKMPAHGDINIRNRVSDDEIVLRMNTVPSEFSRSIVDAIAGSHGMTSSGEEDLNDMRMNADDEGESISNNTGGSRVRGEQSDLDMSDARMDRYAVVRTNDGLRMVGEATAIQNSDEWTIVERGLTQRGAVDSIKAQGGGVDKYSDLDLSGASGDKYAIVKVDGEHQMMTEAEAIQNDDRWDIVEMDLTQQGAIEALKLHDGVRDTSKEEFTTELSAGDTEGNISASISIWEDGTYKLNSASQGDEEGQFDAIIAIKDMGDNVLTPFIIVDDHYSPTRSSVENVKNEIEQILRREL